MNTYMNKNKCDSKLKIVNKKCVKEKVSYILNKNNQDKRAQFIKNREERLVKFGFRRRRLGEKALKDALKATKSVLKSFFNIYYINDMNKKLTNILNSIDVNNKDKIKLLMDQIDLGYRLKERDDPLTVLINLIMFGLVMVNDWQCYLLTPLGNKILADAFNGNIKQQTEVIKMFLNVSCNGVEPTDILSFIPKIPSVDICDKKSAYYWLIDKGIRKAIYIMSVQIGCPSHIVNAWYQELS